MVVHYEDDASSLKQLNDRVFPNLDASPNQLASMINRVILTPKNKYA